MPTTANGTWLCTSLVERTCSLPQPVHLYSGISICSLNGARSSYFSSYGNTCRRSGLEASSLPHSLHRCFLKTIPSSFPATIRSEEHTSELQSRLHLVCRLLLEKKKKEK